MNHHKKGGFSFGQRRRQDACDPKWCEEKNTNFFQGVVDTCITGAKNFYSELLVNDYNTGFFIKPLLLEWKFRGQASYPLIQSLHRLAMPRFSRITPSQRPDAMADFLLRLVRIFHENKSFCLNIERYNESQIRCYLKRMATSIAIDYLKRQFRQLGHEKSLDVEKYLLTTPPQDPNLDLHKALKSISDRQATICRLYYLEGYTLEAIAHQFGLGITSIHNEKRKALQILSQLVAS